MKKVFLVLCFLSLCTTCCLARGFDSMRNQEGFHHMQMKNPSIYPHHNHHIRDMNHSHKPKSYNRINIIYGGFSRPCSYMPCCSRPYTSLFQIIL